MAKISARGAREISRWKKGDSTLVLASDGRLLIKLFKDGGYTVRAKKVTPASAEAFAARYDWRKA